MDVVVIVLYLASVVFNVDGAFVPGADDASWEMHWRLLDIAGQARIAAATSRHAIEELDPEEGALVPGYRRQQRRREARVDLAVAPFLIVGAALALTGLLGAGWFGLGFALSIVATGTWNYLQKRQMDGRLRLVVEAEEAAAS